MKSRVTVLRPSIQVDITTIRDRIIAGYTTIKSNVRCFIEPIGSDVLADSQFGIIGVDRFTMWFDGNETVQTNDVIKKGATFYEIKGVTKFNDLGFHLRCDAVRKNFTMAS